jgi:phosphatidylglycerophosphatase A
MRRRHLRIPGAGEVKKARLVASGFGLGRTPIAPGTAASALALPLGAGLLAAGPPALATATVIASLGGFAALQTARVEGDPGWVVIDEIAGQWITLLGLQRPTLAGLAAAFGLFRLLDITKPGPIGWADRQGGIFGIMGDDVIAGALAAALLWAIRWRWPSLLA